MALRKSFRNLGCSGVEYLRAQDFDWPSNIQRITKLCNRLKGAKYSKSGCEVSVKEVDTLLSLLAEKKKKMEQEEAERNMQILLDFLHCLRKQKVEELSEIQADLQFIKEDISALERHRMELYRARDRYSVKLRMLGDDPTQKWPSTADKCGGGFSSGSRSSLGGLAAGSFQNKIMDGKAQLNSHGPSRKDALSGLDSQYISQSGLAVMRKKRIHVQVKWLVTFILRYMIFQTEIGYWYQPMPRNLRT